MTFISVAIFTATLTFASTLTFITDNGYPVSIVSKELRVEKGIYYLKGDVLITKRDISSATSEEGQIQIQAQEAIYNSITQEAELTGNVIYEDNAMTIKASGATINIKDRRGTLYDAEIVFKEPYLKIITTEVQKLSENHFVFKKATFTTCDAPVPDWCIKGRDVDFIKGDRVSARDATFNIKNIPVFYTPYIWAPALTERKTGFLIPSITYNNRLGAKIMVPFYIVLGEHADSTLLVDLYTERGIGKALELRFRGFPENYLDLNAYHIRDRVLKKDFYEFFLNQQYGYEKGGSLFREFLTINTVTEDFYNTFSPFKVQRLTPFLSSAGELSYTLPSARLFINAQYWQDLRKDPSRVSQKLPEGGISLYPTRLGPFYVSGEALAGNFYRAEGRRSQRLWLNLGILHAFGNKIVFSESLNLNLARYWIDNDAEERTPVNILYTARIFTELKRDYKTSHGMLKLSHTIEPALIYSRIEKVNDDEPPSEFFDRRDIFERESRIAGELINRFTWPEEKNLTIRFTKSYDTLKDSWLPLTADASLRIKGLEVAFKAEYDLKEETFNAATVKKGIRIDRWTLTLAERYLRDLDLLFLSKALDYELTKTLALHSSLWYDLKGGGLRNLQTGLLWRRQCWTLNLRYIKTPEDYSIQASIGLRGF